LDARVFPAAPHSPAAVLSKLAVDQLLFAPFATALLFAFLKVAEGVPEAAFSFVAENWWRTLKANWMLWPAANLVAFAAIPADLRILFANGIGVLWISYVSIACSAPGAGPPPPPLDKLE
jgi:Mpv17 / PMP22 family